MKYISVICGLIFLLSCSNSELSDLNHQIKEAENVPVEYLVDNAIIELGEFTFNPYEGVNNLRYISQFWTTTRFPVETGFDYTIRGENNAVFEWLYTTVLRDLKEAKNTLSRNPSLVQEYQINQEVIIEILEVLAWSMLVDIYGDIPFSEALIDNEYTPVYENDEQIYRILIDKLEVNLDLLSGDVGFNNDIIYHNSADRWRRFGNTLMFKLAMRMADVDQTYAQEIVQKALVNGLMESPSDGFIIPYSGAAPNPMAIDLLSGQTENHIATNTLADYMNLTEDPRRGFYFMDNVIDSSGNTIFKGAEFGATNFGDDFSYPGPALRRLDLPGVIFSYTETLFLLADAAARGFDVPLDATSYYNSAVRASIIEWGGNDEVADQYLSHEKVAYHSADGDWRQKIGQQKWIAMYNNPLEAWSSYRMYDTPELVNSYYSDQKPPKRYIYPFFEYEFNKDNVEAAALAIGGDKISSRIFWDIY